MIIKLQEQSLSLPISKTPRAEGIHVSALIRCVAIETGILKKEWASIEDISLTDLRQITDPTAVLRISIGLAWEEWYIPQIPGVADHPGEMEVDDIYMNHDGESLDVIITGRDAGKCAIILHEVKATYKSSRDTNGDQKDQIEWLNKQWMWIAQAKSYCKGRGTRYILLHVLFICGDYSYPIRPVLKIWAIEFTQKEIDDSWQLLKDYRDHRLGIGK